MADWGNDVVRVFDSSACGATLDGAASTRSWAHEYLRAFTKNVKLRDTAAATAGWAPAPCSWEGNMSSRPKTVGASCDGATMTAMTVSATTARITADEFLSRDYPIGSELIDGMVHVSDPDFQHQDVCLRIIAALLAWIGGPSGAGKMGYGGNWVLNDGHVYKPDVWWTATPPTGTRHDGPPDLAIEVRSPRMWHRDIGPKRDEYRAAGTKELWLVDTPARTVLVYRVGSFDDAVEVGPGEQLTTPLLPGFALATGELFAE